MDTIDFLTITFNDYIQKHNLPAVSADQILAESAYANEEQRQWLVNFIELWENAE